MKPLLASKPYQDLENNTQYFFIRVFCVLLAICLTSCTSMTLTAAKPAQQPTVAVNNNFNTALWDENAITLWNKIQQISSKKLLALQNTTKDPIKEAWIELALINKRYSTNTPMLSRQLIIWREYNPTHPANQFIPSNERLEQLVSNSSPHQIALLLPQKGKYKFHSKKIKEGFLSAYYKSQTEEKPKIKFYAADQSTNIAHVYKQAVADGADFIIGPLIRENVHQLSNSFAFSVPTLALNYTNNSNTVLPTNFFEFGLLPEDELARIAERARNKGLNRAIVIAPQNPQGERLTKAFKNYWQAMGGAVQQSFFYSAHANFNEEIANLLNINSKDKDLQLLPKRRQDFDVIFLFAKAAESRMIVPLLRYYYAHDIPIYATSSIYSAGINPTQVVDLEGVIVCDIPQANQQMTSPIDGTPANRLYAVGQDAYLLSQSLKRLVLLPHFPIYGTTGALTIATSHKIHRRLPCITIHNEFT